MRSRFLFLAVVVLVAASLSSCGKRSSLFMPPEQRATQPTPTAPSASSASSASSAPSKSSATPSPAPTPADTEKESGK